MMFCDGLPVFDSQPASSLVRNASNQCCMLLLFFRQKMVHAGVKVFERNSNARSSIEFRICQEGLDIVLPYMTKRVTRCERVATLWVVVEVPCQREPILC